MSNLRVVGIHQRLLVRGDSPFGEFTLAVLLKGCWVCVWLEVEGHKAVVQVIEVWTRGRKKEGRWIWVVFGQSPSHVWLFVTPWIVARQAFLSFTISRRLLKFMSIVSVITIQPSCPLLSPSSTFNLPEHQGWIRGALIIQIFYWSEATYEDDLFAFP